MKIAIIDSGVHPDHPHVGSVAGGVGVTTEALTEDFIDRLGHGTAVAGAIREKIGRQAELYAVKVFDRRLTANIDVILRALQWCKDERMDVINLSLGTSNPAHRERFEQVLTDGPLVVGAAYSLPGDLPGVIGVAPDAECPRDSYRYCEGVFFTSPFPRPIPGVPPEYNLNGASFSVANMTGHIARFLIEMGASGWTAATHGQIHAALAARAAPVPAISATFQRPSAEPG